MGLLGKGPGRSSPMEAHLFRAKKKTKEDPSVCLTIQGIRSSKESCGVQYYKVKKKFPKQKHMI